MERKSRSALNEQVYEEAGEWFLNFRDGESDPATRGEFDGWVRRSPDHLAAYLEIAAIWNEGPLLDPEGRWDTQALIVQAMQDNDNLVSLDRHASPFFAAGRKISARNIFSRHLSIAAAILTACLCAAAFLWLVQKPVYSTGIGEQRTVMLKDGSRIELNSKSKVKILYSETKRNIELLEGQALFSVSKDPVRPFVVMSGETRVRAIGTQFDVYRKHAGTVVTVVEGRVAIEDDAGPPEKTAPSKGAWESQVVLAAGEQLVVTRSKVRKPAPANIANAIAWTQRQLAFESATLSEVAEEFNRHNERQLVISDRALFDFHISGVFSSADPASLLRFLRDRRGISVVESADEIRVEKIEDRK